MKFRTKAMGPAEVEVKIAKSIGDDIFLQNQVHELDPKQFFPNKFKLRWALEYINGDQVQSHWTPLLEPSITRIIEQRSDIKYLYVYGRNIWNNCDIILARLNYDLVKDFGYTAEGSFINPSVQNIIGIWINLKHENRSINIYVNGLIREIVK